MTLFQANDVASTDVVFVIWHLPMPRRVPTVSGVVSKKDPKDFPVSTNFPSDDLEY